MLFKRPIVCDSVQKHFCVIVLLLRSLLQKFRNNATIFFFVLSSSNFGIKSVCTCVCVYMHIIRTKIAQMSNEFLLFFLVRFERM